MKAIVIPEPGRIVIDEIPAPMIGADDEVLVHVRAGGICGSDIHGYHGLSPFVKYPLVVGHEVAAEVVEIGSKAGGLQVGDHVVLDPVNSCGECYPCSIGRYNVCSNLQVNGAHVPGGFAEYAVFKQKKLYRIASDIPWAHAAVVEPYTIAAQSTARGEVSASDTVLIVGAGPIALVILQACKIAGATCIISDLSAARLERAKENGADYILLAGKESIKDFLKRHSELPGITLAFDAVGIPNILPEILDNMLPAGRVVTLGFAAEPSAVPQIDITKRELVVIGSRLSCNQFPKVIHWFENRLVDPSKIITHCLPFTEIATAMDIISHHPDDCCKIVVMF